MSTTEAGSRFWTEREKYHELAKQFEQNIERTHPKRLSGRSVSWCNCSWCATAVDYYEYNGPNI